MAILWDAAHVFFDTSREAALGRGGLRAFKQATLKAAQSTVGAVLDPCLLARVPVTVFPGESRTICFAVSASDSGENAVYAALRLLRQPRQRGPNRLDRLISTIKMTSEYALYAFELLDKLVAQSTLPCPCAPKELWPYGISGDLPITVAGCGDEAAKQVRAHQLLTRCGYSHDLVFLLDDGGDYRRPVRSAILEELKSTKWEHQLGAKGGVHLIDRPAPALEKIACAAPCFPVSREDAQLPFRALEPGIPDLAEQTGRILRLPCRKPSSPFGWSQMLCNKAFGWVTDETGCGHLWLGNARENALTPWQNDPLAIGGPEWFILSCEDGKRSLFADADGTDCTVTYAPGYARWEKTWACRTVTATAFVPPEENGRYLMIELDGPPCALLHRMQREEERYELTDRLILFTTHDDAGNTAVTRVIPSHAEKEIKLLLNRTVMYWNRLVSSLKIHTPNQKLDDYINGWALYQVIACRLFGRTSRYQNGGAYGFRDQLQDVCAVIMTAPELCREQIRRACARQFERATCSTGGIPRGKGRAYQGFRRSAVAALCSVRILRGNRRSRHPDRRHTLPQSSVLGDRSMNGMSSPRYRKPRARCMSMGCAPLSGCWSGRGRPRASPYGNGRLERRYGFGGCRGKGESVWLAWFLSHVLLRYADLCDAMQEPDRAKRYREDARTYSDAANAAWDGAWFLRGFYDDGSTLGSRDDRFCQIDSIAQSFAVLSAFADGEKTKRAVKSACERLFDREAGVVRLFDPPFDVGDKDPGYIRGYVPGVRENGGQYTHAAVWLSMACLRLNLIDEGYSILNAILPASHDGEVYRASLTCSADVYYNHAHIGRGGWSWYTGAAAGITGGRAGIAGTEGKARPAFFGAEAA
jgi:hypothetical protein